MKPDPGKYYRMPLIMGPLFEGEPPRFVYPAVEVLALQYLTDPDAVAALLPDCYRPGKEAKVTVMFSYNDGLEFMAGRDYRLATVQVAARFDGESDHLEGDYILVMFEDQTWPIIAGREDLGVPKLYADISPVRRLAGARWRCEAALWGHLVMGLELAPLKRQNPVVRIAASRMINERPWLAYKYIPSLDGPPDADYPTITKNDTRIEQLWLGHAGEVYFGDAGADDVGYARPVIDALKTLPVRQIIQALRLRGSAVLRYDLSRRLR